MSSTSYWFRYWLLHVGDVTSLDQSHVSARRFFFPHRSQSNTLSPVSIELAFSLAGLDFLTPVSNDTCPSPVSIHAQIDSLAGLNPRVPTPVSNACPSPVSIQVGFQTMLVPRRSQFDWTFPHPSSIAFPFAGLNPSRLFPHQSQMMALLCPSPASTPGLCLKCIALSHTDFDCTLPRRP